jgi:hypothetical protein
MKDFTPKERTTLIAALSQFAKDMRVEAGFEAKHFNEHDPLSPEEITALCLRVSADGDKPVTGRQPVYLSFPRPIVAREPVPVIIVEKVFRKKGRAPTVFGKVPGGLPWRIWEINAAREMGQSSLHYSFPEAVQDFLERK